MDTTHTGQSSEQTPLRRIVRDPDHGDTRGEVKDPKKLGFNSWEYYEDWKWHTRNNLD